MKIEADGVNVNGRAATEPTGDFILIFLLFSWPGPPWSECPSASANTRGGAGSTLKYRHIKAGNVQRMVEITSEAMARGGGRVG